MTTPINIPLHILEEITNGFSDDLIIGSGGYGNVYKAVYKGEFIAVKLLHPVSGLDDELFNNEVGNLLSVQHPNIVRLRAYCHETHSKYVVHNGKNRLCKHIYRVLCFEYLEGGSLDKLLRDQSFASDWSTRYSIIKGICEGLNFLHNMCEPPIFHLDLKPANILLDNSMVPKVADFGLSRLFGGSHSHATNKAIGTEMYMPPELIHHGIISCKNDVFSLGVVIKEIVRGTIGNRYSEMVHSTQVMDEVRTNWKNIIEATSEYPPEELRQVQTCIDTAVSCMEPEREKRPTIADILSILNKTETRIPNRQKKRKFDELKEVVPHNDSIFILLPPVGRELPLPQNIVGQNSYLKEIVAHIRQGTTSLIGICGMGGAGKTTLLTQVNNTFSRVAELHDFYHVIYVELGQQPDIGTVQQSIASQLGLTLGQYESTKLRSATLYKFLKERKFLLLMDNLWKPLDLVDVGVQGQAEIGPQNRQMLVITTRDQQICHRMKNVNHLILLQRLNLEQAWSLFQVNAGCHRLTNSSAEIRVHAKIIVEKCGGLPLALKVVGQAMASKKSEHDWKLAVILLEQSQYHKVPDADVESDLYHVLYISYNQLQDERTKQCFLLFALIALEDCMYVQYAINFWMGHGLLDGDGDISKNYLRGHSVVGCLKRACLLEEHPRGENYLRMHDTIRGLVLWIVKRKQGDGPNKNWLVRSGKEIVEPEEFHTAHRIYFWDIRGVVDLGGPCSRLLTLIYRGNGLKHIPTGFFGIATSLTYLDLSDSLIRELPSGFGKLVNLQYLGLARTPIQSIPMELQLFKSLRYLDLSGTTELKAIPDGTISALIMLRSLSLYNSWCFPADKTETHIEELKSLTWLQSLGLTLGDYDSLQQILDHSKSSVKYLSIENAEGLRVLNITPALFSTTRAHQLESLRLYGMNSLEELSIGETIVDSDWNFEILDELRLVDITKLENIIWKGVVPHACLPRLRVLIINGCHGTRAITWIKQLPCLEEVYLVYCHSILELVADDAGGLTMSSDGDSFPRLKWLVLSCLPNLQNICDRTLAFPCLQRLLVYNCPKLAKLPTGLLQPEHVPLILCQKKLWEQLSWEDRSVKTALFPFFRDLPEGFQGDIDDVYKALIT